MVYLVVSMGRLATRVLDQAGPVPGSKVLQLGFTGMGQVLESVVIGL